MPPNPRIELVCPAGSLPALKAAVDNGADCVYIGLRDNTNARNFAGLNFDARGRGRGRALRPCPRRQGAARDQHLPAARRLGALDTARSTPPPTSASTR